MGLCALLHREPCEQPLICGKCQSGFVTVWVGINLQCLEPNSLLLKYYTWASLALLAVVAAV